MASRRDRPVVIVTGASAGVGRATALAFANRGWRVGLIARGRERLRAAETDVELAGGAAMAVAADVADADAMFRAAGAFVAEWGRIDVWVNNAMATIYAPVAELDPGHFKRVTEVTYLGYVHGTLAALRHMRPAGRGTIVQVGSALAYRSIPLQSAYCAAKAAIRGFTDSLRSELIREGSGIRLTMAQLPAVNTPQFDWSASRLPNRLQPVPPIHQPEVIAAEIFAAARDAPRELWIGRPTMQAILGTMIAPGLLDRLAAKQAWDGQMAPEPAEGDTDGNLFDPVLGDFGAHGRFDRQARRRVVSASAATTTALAAGAGIAAVAGLAAGGYALLRRSRRRRREISDPTRLTYHPDYRG